MSLWLRRSVVIISPDRVLPEQFIRRARAHADRGESAAPVRDAATIALLRDEPDGLEVYLLRRVATMAFASGMHVFPGGTVDPRDLEHDLSWVGPPPSAWAERFGVDDGRAQGLVLAAVRETFEESGILLAGLRPDDGDLSAGDAGGIVVDTAADAWEADRLALVDRSLSFSAMLERRNLVVRADLVRAWARWMTPEFEPLRYDAAVFVAAVPTGQQTRAVGGEADRVAWIRPRVALSAMSIGDVLMLPPTAAVLRELAEHDSVDAVLQAAQHRTITTIMPRPVLDVEVPYFVLPGELGYDR